MDRGANRIFDRLERNRKPPTEEIGGTATGEEREIPQGLFCNLAQPNYLLLYLLGPMSGQTQGPPGKDSRNGNQVQ